MKLQESKEKLPLSFLTDFVSRSWDSLGLLKQEIAAIKEEFSGTKKVEELMQGIVDAYLVCIGQLELHMQNNDYLEFPEEAKTESLALKESTPERQDGEAPAIEEGKEHETQPSPAASADSEDVEIELNTETANASADAKADEHSDDFEYFCDFDEPSGEAITDDELYQAEAQQ